MQVCVVIQMQSIGKPNKHSSRGTIEPEQHIRTWKILCSEYQRLQPGNDSSSGNADKDDEDKDVVEDQQRPPELFGLVKKYSSFHPHDGFNAHFWYVTV